MKLSIPLIISSMVFGLMSYGSIASIKVDRTRLIYNEGSNGVVLNVTSMDSTDMLIQSWLTESNGNQETKTMIVVPPIQQLTAGQTRAVRVLNKGGNLPKDRESVFWLHVQEIPQKDKSQTNTLKLAVRNSLKVFWRPASIANEAANYSKILSKVKWIRSDSKLMIENMTPFYLTLNKIVGSNNQIQLVNRMIPPFGKLDLTLSISEASRLVFIDDFGGFPEIAL